MKLTWNVWKRNSPFSYEELLLSMFVFRRVHSVKLTLCLWKWMVGRLLSFWCKRPGFRGPAVSFREGMSCHLAILCDLFGIVKWPFQRLRDLQLGDKKITLNHLKKINHFKPAWGGPNFGSTHQLWWFSLLLNRDERARQIQTAIPKWWWMCYGRKYQTIITWNKSNDMGVIPNSAYPQRSIG